MSPVELDQVRAALVLEAFDVLGAQRRMAPQPRPLQRSRQRTGTPRQAGVLVLLFPTENGLAFPLIRRTENQHDVHSGQIGLPGGSLEDGETPLQAALREAHEEVGIEEPIQILGTLTKLYIPPSDFDVFPVVAAVDFHPEWKPDPLEVVEVVECPLDWLLNDDKKLVEDWEIDGFSLRVPWYNIYGHRVWGATAIMLSELEQRLRHILES